MEFRWPKFTNTSLSTLSFSDTMSQATLHVQQLFPIHTTTKEWLPMTKAKGFTRTGTYTTLWNPIYIQRHLVHIQYWEKWGPKYCMPNHNELPVINQLPTDVMCQWNIILSCSLCCKWSIGKTLCPYHQTKCNKATVTRNAQTVEIVSIQS